MFKSTLREKWSSGQTTINGWLAISNAFSAEVMSVQDYDSLTVDLQHGVVGYEGLVPMVQAMQTGSAASIVRVPWLSPGEIMKALDLGIEGVICPMINTGDEAAELVRYCRYPPKGERSFGPTRANFALAGQYYGSANDEVVVFAMVETGDAVRNVNDIASTDGIDGIYIGPSDLSLGVTQGRLVPALDREEEEMIDTIKSILEAAKNAGKVAAIHCGTPEYAVRAASWGFDMVTVSSDVKLMAEGAANTLKSVREGIGQSAQDGVLSPY